MSSVDAPIDKPSRRHTYCADHNESLTCPKCGAKSVHVRAADHYTDGYEYDAFCDACDVTLRVWASVTIDFSEPDLADDEVA